MSDDENVIPQQSTTNTLGSDELSDDEQQRLDRVSEIFRAEFPAADQAAVIAGYNAVRARRVA